MSAKKPLYHKVQKDPQELTPYERLAIQIIKQAVTEYRIKLRQLNRRPKGLVEAARVAATADHDTYTDIVNRWGQRSIALTLDVLGRLTELESFFRSDYFVALTDLDGETIIRRIKEKEQRHQ